MSSSGCGTYARPGRPGVLLGPPGRRTTGGRALQPKSTSLIHWPAAGQVEPQKEAPELVDWLLGPTATAAALGAARVGSCCASASSGAPARAPDSIGAKSAVAPPVRVGWCAEPRSERARSMESLDPRHPAPVARPPARPAGRQPRQQHSRVPSFCAICTVERPSDHRLTASARDFRPRYLCRTPWTELDYRSSPVGPGRGAAPDAHGRHNRACRAQASPTFANDWARTYWRKTSHEHVPKISGAADLFPSSQPVGESAGLKPFRRQFESRP